jgi:hypothetical protein
MKTSIKIVKRKQDKEPNDPKTLEAEKSVERSTREMVSTVKNWITELQQRKRGRGHLFSGAGYRTASG